MAVENVLSILNSEVYLSQTGAGHVRDRRDRSPSGSREAVYINAKYSIR